MQNALLISLRQLEQAAERELSSLLSAMRLQRLSGGRLDWEQCARGYASWAESSAHVGLLARILVYENHRGELGTLRELPLGAAEPVAAEWEPRLESVKDALSGTDGQLGRRSESWPLTWTLFPDARALVRLIAPLDWLRGRASRSLHPVRPSAVILVLDWAYVVEEMLPTLIERLFSGTDGERLYQVAIAAGDGQSFLYRSDASIDADWLAAADRRQPIRLFQPAQAVQQGPSRPSQRPPAALRRTRMEAILGDRLGLSRSPRPGEQGGRRPLVSVRRRIAIAGATAGLAPEFAVAHVSGSLADAVAQQRVRNLGMGLGVLLLLAGAMALVFASARRAGRLAAMQMEFIAGVTHELRTPLAVISSIGENLSDGVVSSAEGAKRYGRLIADQAKRLSGMVEDTLQFVSLESGGGQFTLAAVDPALALQRAVEEAQPMVEQAGFELERGGAADLPQVRADERALQQILANLISNAVKYGNPGRWIRVEAEAGKSAGGRGVQIRIHDRGKGIAKEERAHIFDAFYRGPDAVAEGIQGSGLGLKLARDLALGMGAKLSLRSEPGRGSVFTLHLPVLAERDA